MIGEGSGLQQRPRSESGGHRVIHIGGSEGLRRCDKEADPDVCLHEVSPGGPSGLFFTESCD